VRSLRGRLTLGVTLVVAAVLLGAGTILLRDVERSELDALDDRLRRTAELSSATAVAAVEQELPGGDRRLDAVLRATGTSLRLLLGTTVLLDTGAPPAAPPPRGRGATEQLRTYTAGGRRYRAYTATLDDPDLGGLARLEVVTRLTALERRQADLRERLLLVGAGALLLAALGVWVAADLVLRPLRRLRAATAAIAGEEDLRRRVPTDDGPAELRSLAATFNAMLGRLGRSAEDRERALAATRRFAADAGHELRTPLTSVQATLSSLRRHPDVPAERRGALLDDALAEHRRIVDLLDGLQALARGDALAVDHAPVDLADVVGTAAGLVDRRHPDVEVAVGAPGHAVVVEGWEPGLRLLVENLLENAARHGRPGGRVRATLEAADGAAPVLHVDDDGPGIPAADRARVFEPFVRVHGEERPGSGLGLALVAQQARHHGAEVAVGDGPLGGARVTVRFAPAGH